MTNEAPAHRATMSTLTGTADSRNPERMHPPEPGENGNRRAPIQEPRLTRSLRGDSVPGEGLSEREIYFNACTARSARRRTFRRRGGSGRRGHTYQVRNPRS